MEGGSGRTPGIALAVSGGGFRATLFHLGALWRLNELGLLHRMKVITSVSGGSIAAGYLGYRWGALHFDARGVAADFEPVVVGPLRAFCGRTHDLLPALLGALPWVSGGDLLARGLARLFGEATLQALPDEARAPRFLIYATSLQTGVSVRLCRAFLRDYTVGKVAHPTVRLAKAVAASCAFPPFLSPVTLDARGASWKRERGNAHASDPRFTDRLVLTDGGVYDNMGLEAIWNRYETVLVSDAGAPFDAVPAPWSNWLATTWRSFNIAVEQGRSLRRRWLVRELRSGRLAGAHWSIGTHIAAYGLADPLLRDDDRTRSLARLRTRLDAFSDEEQRGLINWGYALADAALRRQLPSPAYPAGRLPCPRAAG
jgi:NTE family protein